MVGYHGDSGHADLHTAEGFMPSEMITHAYLLNKDKKRMLELLQVMKLMMNYLVIEMYSQKGV